MLWKNDRKSLDGNRSYWANKNNSSNRKCAEGNRATRENVFFVFNSRITALTETKKTLQSKIEMSKELYEQCMKDVVTATQKLIAIRDQLIVITNRVNELKKVCSSDEHSPQDQ